MHNEVKKCVEAKDIKGLRYIFVDCLDVDPTFEKYREDYEYSKRVAGLFEEHKELTPLTDNRSSWDNQYWQKIKTDLMKNFSVKRFQHMIEVAKVVYADKIERIKKERAKFDEAKQNTSRIENATKPKSVSEQPKRQPQIISNQATAQAKKAQSEMLEAERRRLERENEEALRREREQKQRLEARRRQIEAEEREKNNRMTSPSQRTINPESGSKHRSNSPKKTQGIAPIIIIAVIIILLVIILLLHKE